MSKPQNPGFIILICINIITIIYKINCPLKWGSNPRLSWSFKRRTSRSSRPRTQQSSAQEGHDTFKVLNFSLHEMIKSFKYLEIPIGISAFSSPALFSVLIPLGLLGSFVFSDSKARLFMIKLIRKSSTDICFLTKLKFKASFCICLQIIDMVILFLHH